MSKTQTAWGAKVLALLLSLVLTALAVGGCGGEKPAPEESAPASTTPEDIAQTGLSTELDQYYVNENFMAEMLVNADCVIQENGSNLTITTSENHAALVLSLIPGIQNLAAAGELALSTVQQSFPEATIDDISDANLFGARAKLCNYEVPDESGAVTLMGIEAAAIVNQSCYFLNVMMEAG